MLSISMIFRSFCSILFAVLFVGCQSEPKDQIFTIQGEAQGSTYMVKYVAADALVSKAMTDSLLQAFDGSLSTYQPNSLISRVNRGDTTVVVDQWFAETFRASERIYRATDGLFDPTIGVLVNAYGFGPSKTRVSLSQPQLDSVLQYVGFDKVTLRDDFTIHKQYPETYFDFNAIAQGYAVDVLIDFLKAKGISNALVEIGGEIAGIGRNVVEDKPWIVGIDDPLQTPEERKLIAKISLENLGMATSGNYRKVVVDTVTGQQFVHTINPKTGLPEKSNILSATVLAQNCADADGYATAFMVMPFDAVMSFLENNTDVYVLLIYTDASKKVKQYMTPNFQQLMLD